MRFTLAAGLLAASLLGTPLPLRSQEDAGGIAYVSPRVPDDPNLAKVTQLRLLYTGSPTAPAICLARESQGLQPAIIETNLSTGALSPYVAMRPERFKLHILDGSVTEDPVEKLTLKEKKLTEPLDLELKPGTYQTLLVREQGGKISASLVSDTRPEGSSPVMRVLDLSGVDGWSIRLLDRRDKLVQALWSSANGAAATGITLPSSGVFRVQVLRSKSTGSQQMGLFEAKIDAGTPFSIVLYPGSDGEGAADLAFDAAPGPYYNAEAIKKLAEGGAP